MTANEINFAKLLKLLLGIVYHFAKMNYQQDTLNFL